jgi:hypothetical protein
LQQKYGHVIEKPSIAPPPTTSSFSTAPVSSVPPPTIFNRYVPYDTNQIAPPVYAQQGPSYNINSSAQPPLSNPSPRSQPSPSFASNVQTSSDNPSPVTVSRLLGNKAIPVDLSAFADTSLSNKSGGTSPKEDGEVIINASSNSSSVL